MEESMFFSVSQLLLVHFGYYLFAFKKINKCWFVNNNSNAQK